MFSKDCFSLVFQATIKTDSLKIGESLRHQTFIRGALRCEKSQYKNGRKDTKYTWKNGLQDGLEQEWYKNGRKFVERTWKNGEIA